MTQGIHPDIAVLAIGISIVCLAASLWIPKYDLVEKTFGSVILGAIIFGILSAIAR